MSKRSVGVSVSGATASLLRRYQIVRSELARSIRPAVKNEAILGRFAFVVR